MSKSNYVVNDEQKTISAVIADLTEREKKEIKNYMEFGYTLTSTQRPKKEKSNSIYTEKDVQAFLKEYATEEQMKDYNKIYNEQAKNSKTGEPLVYKADSKEGTKGKKHKKGDPVLKGHIATIQWFKRTFEEDFAKYLSENKSEESENKSEEQ